MVTRSLTCLKQEPLTKNQRALILILDHPMVTRSLTCPKQKQLSDKRKYSKKPNKSGSKRQLCGKGKKRWKGMNKNK